MNTQLISTLKTMREFDQGSRFDSLKNGDFSKYTIYAIDVAHNHLIHNIVKTYGYPTKDMVGEEGLFDFWLLIQHQDLDIPLQDACLAHCDFAPKEKAMLSDRVLLHKGLKQIYGTQFHRVDGVLVPQPIEDETQVNTRRKEVGLETLEEYTETMHKRDDENKKIKDLAS